MITFKMSLDWNLSFCFAEISKIVQINKKSVIMGNLKIFKRESNSQISFSTFISTFAEADRLFPYLTYGYN